MSSFRDGAKYNIRKKRVILFSYTAPDVDNVIM